MKVCIFGAGAIGGYLAARLLKAGEHEVSVLARGAHLQAIRHQGLRLITPTEDFVVHPHTATDQPSDLPPQDVVLVTLKAHTLPAIADQLVQLLRPEGQAVFINNGIPWWWTLGTPDAQPLPLLDPQGQLQHALPARQVIGGVVYSANAVIAPGVVRHTANNQWILGQPDGQTSPQLAATVRGLCHAGLNAESSDTIRHWVWKKLLRNAAMNSLCALTRVSVDQLAHGSDMLALYQQLVEEIAAVAAAQGHMLQGEVEAAKRVPLLGAAIDGTPSARIKPSMLQDVEAGRSLEVEAIVGQVQAFARQHQVSTPVLDAVVPLLRTLNAQLSQRAAATA